MTLINNLNRTEYRHLSGNSQNSNSHTFLQKQAFFECLQATNRSTTKCPALAKKPQGNVNDTRQVSFVSSLTIGHLISNGQPTAHVSKPQSTITFGTHFNRNIDTHSIGFEKSFAFFKNLANK